MVEQIEYGKLYHELSYDEYHDVSAGLNALRASHLKHLKKSPAHLKAALDEPRSDTDAFRQGRLVHKFLENPEKFMDTHVVEPTFSGKTKDGKDSTRSAEAKILKTQWYADLKPETLVVRQDDIAMIKGISKAVREHTLIRNMLKEGVSETSLWVKDPQYEVAIACRPDFIAKAGYIVDLKTTRSADQHDFVRDIFSPHGYHYILQAALYAKCAKLAGLDRPDSFTFIAIEKEPPFCLNVFPMDHGCLEVGNSYIEKLLPIYAECIQKNTWPGYSDKAIPVEIPQWVGWAPDYQ